MKKYTIVLGLLFYVSLYSQSIVPYIEQISKEEIKGIVYTLSSPKMMGRDTGEKGQKDAAKYIADFYRQRHIDSLQQVGYEQDFDLMKLETGKASLKYNYLLTGKDSTVVRTLNSYWIANGALELMDTLPSIYLGYGEQSTSADLSRQVVILLSNGSMKKTHQYMQRLHQENQAQYFVIGCDKTIFIGSLPEQEELIEAEDTREYMEALKFTKGKHLPENFSKKEQAIKTITTQLPEDVLCYYVSKWQIQRIMGEKPKDLYKAEKKRLKGKEYVNYSPKIDTFFCNIKTNMPEKKTITTENVLAYIEGSDLKDEVIVVSGHYDHLGAKNDNTIYYGADDNASGTTAVMQVAATLQKAANDGIRPRRSLICVAFSGEEIGLRGSDYFVNNCPVSTDNIVLNLNMDMIGRNCGEKADSAYSVYLINKGKKEHYVRRATKQIAKDNDSLIVSTHPGFKEKMTWSVSSDHFRFARKGIPIACLFTGLHPDYHTPRDTPDKINYNKLYEICKLSTEAVWTIANSDKKLLKKHKAKDEGFMEKMMD